MARRAHVDGGNYFASAIAVLFGAYEQDGAHFLFAIPEIVFEFSITIYTIVKGFRPSPILDDTRYAREGECPGGAALARQQSPANESDQLGAALAYLNSTVRTGRYRGARLAMPLDDGPQHWTSV